MSLYDGLGIDDKEGGGKVEPKGDVAGWSSSFKLLQTQIKAKKASLLQTKKKSGATLAPVVNLRRHHRDRDDDYELRFNQQTGKMERMKRGSADPVVSLNAKNDRGISTPPFIGAEAPSSQSLLGVSDEYNPYNPNDYEEFIKKRREQRQKEREEERRKDLEEREKRRKERHKEAGYHDSDDEGEFDKRRRMRRNEDEEDDYSRSRPSRGGGAAIAPPSSLIEESTPSEPEEPKPEFEPPRPALGASLGLAGSVASKIMAKYGYKEGQGLGAKEQGMSTALLVEKTSKRGGKIIHEKDLPKLEPPRAENTNANLLKSPSKVILLRNMVGPGEVDEDLEPETAEECTKYGKVVKCLIFEMPGAVEEEAVRIFVEFEKQDSAIKAIIDLNGRFFGGRVVQACFYNLDKFRRLDLVDDP